MSGVSLLNEMGLDPSRDLPPLARHLLHSMVASKAFSEHVLYMWNVFMPHAEKVDQSVTHSLFCQMAETLLCASSLRDIIDPKDREISATRALSHAILVSRESELNWTAADKDAHKVSYSLMPFNDLPTTEQSEFLDDQAEWVPSTMSVGGRYWVSEKKLEGDVTKRVRLLLKADGPIGRPLRRFEMKLPRLVAMVMKLRATMDSATECSSDPATGNELRCGHLGCSWSTSKGERGLKIHSAKMHEGKLFAKLPEEHSTTVGKMKNAVSIVPANILCTSTLLRCPTTGDEFERRVALREYFCALANGSKHTSSKVHVIEAPNRELYSVLADSIRWHNGPLKEYLESNAYKAALLSCKDKTQMAVAANDLVINRLLQICDSVVILNAYKAPAWDLCVLCLQDHDNGGVLSIRYIQCKYYPNSPFRPDYDAEAIKMDNQLLRAAHGLGKSNQVNQLLSGLKPLQVNFEMLSVMPSPTAVTLRTVPAHTLSVKQTAKKQTVDTVAILTESTIVSVEGESHCCAASVAIATSETTTNPKGQPLDHSVPSYRVFEYPAGSEALASYWHPLPLLESVT